MASSALSIVEQPIQGAEILGIILFGRQFASLGAWTMNIFDEVWNPMDDLKGSKCISALHGPRRGGLEFAFPPAVFAAALALGLATQPVQAALSFSFNYLNPGDGFEDPTFGSDRQAALNSAADMLGAYFVNYSANLTYDVTSYSTDNSTLASASSDQFLVPGTFQGTIVQDKILSNGVNDGNGGDADGYIDWNFFHNWGLSDNPAQDELDFKSTAIHELLHSFGFSSNIGSGGTGLDGLSPGTADTWAVFDNFLTDASGDRLIGTDGVFDPSKVGALTDGGNNPGDNSPGVLFSGSNAIAANGGEGIPIYSPDPFEEGSSIAHLDDYSDVTDQSIMNAAAHNDGLDTRTLGPIEIGIMKDIGYTEIVDPAVVPLPAAAWFLVSGLLPLLGFRRRRQSY
jgi:hypothetical protein